MSRRTPPVRSTLPRAPDWYSESVAIGGEASGSASSVPRVEPLRLDLDDLGVPAPKVSPSPPLPVPGEIIGGTYRVERELGSGAMGVVLLAIDQRLNRQVAIKLVQSSLFGRNYVQRFLQEARAMAGVTHPNLLVIHAFGEHRSAPYFVSEFVSGGTLADLITEHAPKVELGLALRILDEVCAGVAALHAAGLVHRDLKPANILLDLELGVRVADFGLAQSYLGGRAAREMAGTLGYLAPELLTREGGPPTAAASPRSDVYSVACMAYELLTGRPPFDSRTDEELILQHATSEVVRPSAVRGDLPLALDLILLRALAKDPALRTSDLTVLRRELRAVAVKGAEPRRILIADDDEDFQSLLELKLRAEFPDTEVERVADGDAALRAFARSPASVVILDLEMPLLDGFAVTRALRARADSESVPILVVTASGGPDAWRLLSSLGADRLLVKPVDLDDVVAIVRRTLKLRSERLAQRPG